MPPQITTLAQQIIFNDVSLADLMVSDFIYAGTMFNVLHAEESSNGDKHEYWKELTAPTVGFRDPGKSANNSPGTKEQVLTQLKVLDATAHEDKAIADNYKHGPDDFMAMRGLENFQAGVHLADRQFIYGTNVDGDGFVGLVENDGLNALADDKVVDAQGSGNDVEDIWIIRTGQNAMAAIYNGDTPLTIEDRVTQQLNEYDSSGNAIGQFTGYVTPIMSWLGLQFGSIHDVVRIANVDVTANDVEDYVQDGIALFPSTHQPTHVFTSRRGRRAIQRSRTSISDAARQPIPTDVDGVSLEISEAIVGAAALT